MSHKPDGRLPLLSARLAVTLQPLRWLLRISLLGEQRRDGCEQFVQDCYPTASRLRFEPGPFCAWVQHAKHSAAEPPVRRMWTHKMARFACFHHSERRRSVLIAAGSAQPPTEIVRLGWPRVIRLCADMSPRSRRSHFGPLSVAFTSSRGSTRFTIADSP